MTIHRLLDRLDGVRARGDNAWMAKCPAHDDRTPSLAVTARGNKILIHCHGGCGAADVLDAIGLQLSDLFLDTPKGYHAPPTPGARPMSRQALRKATLLASHHAHRAAVAAATLEAGGTLSPDDIDLLCQAASELNALRIQFDQWVS